MRKKIISEQTILKIIVFLVTVITLTLTITSYRETNADESNVDEGTIKYYRFTYRSQTGYEESTTNLAGWLIYDKIEFTYTTESTLEITYHNSTSVLSGTTTVNMLDNRSAYGYIVIWNPFYNEFRTTYFNWNVSFINTTNPNVSNVSVTVGNNYIEFLGNRSSDGLSVFGINLHFNNLTEYGTVVDNTPIAFDEIPTDIAEAELRGYIKGKQEGYANTENDLQQEYNKGFTKGREYQASLENTDFKDLIYNVINAPITYLQSMLGIEILGTNIYEFFTGLVTVALGIWVVRLLI